MTTDDRENFRELNPADLRGILKYVPQWRNHTFVIALDGAVLDDENFNNIMLELAVLRNLSIRVILVYGIGDPLMEAARNRGIELSDARGYGKTDLPTRELATEVAASVGHRIVKGLTQQGLKYAWTNAVRATERGIIQGVDLQYTGKVEKIDTNCLERLMEQELIPVLSPICFTRDAMELRLNSDLLASELAIALKASKLIFLMPYPGLTYRGEFRLNASVQEVRKLLDEDPECIDVPVRSKADYAVKTIEGGTPRAHIIDSQIHDGLLMEIFSKVGIGSMIHSNPYAQIRPARRKDAGAIFNLTKSAVKDESLRGRSRTSIEESIFDYYVYDIDESVIGCFRLSPVQEDGYTVELGSVFVHPAYQNRHIGRAMIEFGISKARETGFKRMIALTTQSAPFFKNNFEFREGSKADLPDPLQEVYATTNRNSHVLVKDLS